MKGKLIILEGTDASGKSTQFKLLCDSLDDKKVKYQKVVFPRYQEQSSVLLRMYLNGEFGQNPNDVSAYASSILFAVDRFASYKKEWGEFYNNGGIVICDRYTTSNAIHQAAKLDGAERKKFCDWLFDLEYNLMGMPSPDKVLFLDMPTECAIKLLENRVGKEKDIHEKDTEYLKECRQAALSVCDIYGWEKISCANDGQIKSIQEIHGEIIQALSKLIF